MPFIDDPAERTFREHEQLRNLRFAAKVAEVRRLTTPAPDEIRKGGKKAARPIERRKQQPPTLINGIFYPSTSYLARFMGVGKVTNRTPSIRECRAVRV